MISFYRPSCAISPTKSSDELITYPAMRGLALSMITRFPFSHRVFRNRIYTWWASSVQNCRNMIAKKKERVRERERERETHRRSNVVKRNHEPVPSGRAISGWLVKKMTSKRDAASGIERAYLGGIRVRGVSLDRAIGHRQSIIGNVGNE